MLSPTKAVRPSLDDPSAKSPPSNRVPPPRNSLAVTFLDGSEYMESTPPKESATNLKNAGLEKLTQLALPEEHVTLGRKLGGGSYGTVHKGLIKATGEIVAVKVVELPDPHEAQDEMANFALELELLAQHSNHPNIAAFWGAHLRPKEDLDSKAELWITMELCSYGSAGKIAQCVTYPKDVKGVPAWQKLRQGKPPHFSEEILMHLTRGCIKGLEYLHSKNVIHRDIKGHNILIAADLSIKLCDFGISTTLHEAKNKRMTTIGTPYWMAPEVIACSPSVKVNTFKSGYSKPCDIWSIGITMIELAEGFPPYLLDTPPMPAMMLIIKNKPPTLNLNKERAQRTWSTKLKEFLALLLNKDPNKRPTVEQLLNHPMVAAGTPKKAMVEFKTICQTLYPGIEPENEWHPKPKQAENSKPRKLPFLQQISKIHAGKRGSDLGITGAKAPTIDPSSIRNLSELEETSEKAIVSILADRYSKDHVFTNVGNILVFCNPFTDVGLFSESSQRNFMDRTNISSDDQPHIFMVAQRAYADYLLEGHSQSCVISGISGAGKTENAKQFIRHVASLSIGDLVGDSTVPLVQKMLAMSHVLEAFGNAKTQQNSNSSRFGQYLAMKFDTFNKVHGAHLSTYLLEKSRVVSQGDGEQNYHVFYYLIAAADRGIELTEGLDLKLADGIRFRYLAGNPHFDADYESKQFVDLTFALRKIGFSSSLLRSMCKALGTCLHIGQIEFTESTDGNLCVKTRTALETVGTLLQMPADAIATQLCTATTVARGEEITRQLTQEKAEDTRDAFAKTLYCRMFAWVVTEMNSFLNRGMDGQCRDEVIGVLDIFGFESQKKNSFEQLCINAANEQLHHFFNTHIFKWELKELKQEGINLADVSFTNNESLLSLLFGRPVGVFSLLDEESFFPNATATSLLQKVQKHFKKSTEFNMKKGSHIKDFVISHFAGNVVYDADGFLSKNRDHFSDKFQQLLSDSPNDFVAMLFQAEATLNGSFLFDLSRTECLKSSEGKTSKSKLSSIRRSWGWRKSENKGRTSKAGQAAKKYTLAMQFKSSLNELMTKVTATRPHFVRCIKPNHKKASSHFERETVVTQLRSTGVLETVRIRREGFAVRMKFEDFINTYRVLLPGSRFDAAAQQSVKKACEQILSSVTPASDRLQARRFWIIGSSRVLMKYKCSEQLKSRLRLFQKSAEICQRAYRRHALGQFLQRRHAMRKKHKDAMVAIVVEELVDECLQSLCQSEAQDYVKGQLELSAAVELIAEVQLVESLETMTNEVAVECVNKAQDEIKASEQADATVDDSRIEEKHEGNPSTIEAVTTTHSITPDNVDQRFGTERTAKAVLEAAVNQSSIEDSDPNQTGVVETSLMSEDEAPEPTPRPSRNQTPQFSSNVVLVSAAGATKTAVEEEFETPVPIQDQVHKQSKESKKKRKKFWSSKRKKLKKQQNSVGASSLSSSDSFSTTASGIGVKKKNRLGGILSRVRKMTFKRKQRTEDRIRASVTAHIIQNSVASPDLDAIAQAQTEEETLITEESPSWKIPLQPFDPVEYERIDQNLATYDELPPNIEHLNRYQNVLANGHSRVRIEPSSDNPMGYINANYISAFDGTGKAYIAAQGPKTETIYHFWQMIWESNCRAIIMVTGLEEGGRQKCARYWPNVRYNEELKCGDLQLNDINIAVTGGYRKNCYITSKLRVRRGDETREIRHFWYDTWPDHGVPSESWPVAVMLRAVRAWSNDADQPWVVHCSAGIGRTGTFIGIDLGMHMLMETESVDVNNIVYKLRQERGGMVQHAEQASFIHSCLQSFSERIEEKMQMITKEEAPAATTSQASQSSSAVRTVMISEMERRNSRLRMLYPTDHPKTNDPAAVLEHSVQRAIAFAPEKVHKSQVTNDEGDEDRIPEWRLAQLEKKDGKRQSKLMANLSNKTPKLSREQSKLSASSSRKSDIEKFVDALPLD